MPIVEEMAIDAEALGLLRWVSCLTWNNDTLTNGKPPMIKPYNTLLTPDNEHLDVPPLPEHIQSVFSRSICLYTKVEVEAAIDNMASQMRESLVETNPIFLCVVVGGIVLMGSLLLRLDFPLELDYVHATRYGRGLRGETLEWRVKPSLSIRGRNVVIIDDILDGGVTLNAIIAYCQSEGAQRIYSAVLVDKEQAELIGGQGPDFVGLKAEDHYLFGYGMDYKGYLRNAPGVYRVSEQDHR